MKFCWRVSMVTFVSERDAFTVYSITVPLYTTWDYTPVFEYNNYFAMLQLFLLKIN